MVFLNDSHLLMTWYDEHCLQTVRFPDMSNSTYAGLCGTSGAEYNKPRLDLRLGTVVGVTYDDVDTVYTSLYSYKRIISIDMNTEIGIWLCGSTNLPQYLAFDKYSGDVYVSMQGGLGIIKADDPTQHLEVSIGAGESIGNLSDTKIDTGRDLVQLDEGVLMLADKEIDR